MNPSPSLLRLLQISSASFPIGAFAYSQGVENAVDTGWIKTEVEALEWIGGQLRHGVTALDVPFLKRFYAAWHAGEWGCVAALAQQQLAFREARELREEEHKLGRSTLRALGALGAPPALTWSGPMTWVGAYALGAAFWNIPLHDAACGYLYAWCENQVIAASRLIPLGQQSAQRVLSSCLERVPECVEHGFALPDDEIGLSAPGHVLACMAHETQYSRLFLS